MGIREIYKLTSERLLVEFEKSNIFNHNGNKGNYREKALKDFLSTTGILPIKYGITTGEIINSKEYRSKQCDLIIYNKLEGITFLGGDDSTDLVPIECVYGVTEIKSRLSKEELIKGLENIKSVKHAGYETEWLRKSNPFGIIFAYSLSDNSLDSLKQNLIDWESQNDRKYWPDFVAVLNKGILFHNHADPVNFPVLSIECDSDTLFYFYYHLLRLCNERTLSPVPILDYIM